LSIRSPPKLFATRLQKLNPIPWLFTFICLLYSSLVLK
jgi:hypothetical protein